MTFDELKENFDMLLEMLSTKEKFKILNLSFSAIQHKKNSKLVKSLIRATRKEYRTYTERKCFEASLIDKNLIETENDYNFIEQCFEIMNDKLQKEAKKRINNLIRLSIMSCSYYLSEEERERLYQLITDLDNKRD